MQTNSVSHDSPPGIPPSLSIVIPAFNEEKLLPRCLASVRNAIAQVNHERDVPAEIEVIVTDNNSTDRTAEVAREAGARVVFEAVNQIARARNAGAGQARAAWLLFLDADSILAPRNLQAVLELAVDQRVVGGGCVVGLDERPWSVRLLLGVWNTISRCFRWAAGSFLFCRREAFEAIGGFSLELYAAEEIDLSRRLKRHGRESGQRFVILTQCPHISSARKLHLYSAREQLMHLVRCAFRTRSTLRSRETLDYFYDGRR
jgi:glycosyltransferase involved in cell wall biosynthesis